MCAFMSKENALKVRLVQLEKKVSEQSESLKTRNELLMTMVNEFAGLKSKNASIEEKIILLQKGS